MALTRRSPPGPRGDLDAAGLGAAEERDQPVGHALGRILGEDVEEAAARRGHQRDDLQAVEAAVAIGIGAGQPLGGAGLQLGAGQGAVAVGVDGDDVDRAVEAAEHVARPLLGDRGSGGERGERRRGGCGQVSHRGHSFPACLAWLNGRRRRFRRGGWRFRR